MTATDSYLLLRAFVDELARCGMRDACTSPGSRCTPIVLTLAREPRIRCWSHIDERCAGFFALGAAKASGTPVAVTCTSGTAAANLAGAVIEAHHAGVPLIVLTADRPPELREIGAGQTIDQLKLYGGAAKWFFELGVQEATPARLRWIRALACRAYWTALEGRPGPVHLNVPLREPLVLDGPLGEEPGGGGRRAGKPWVCADRPGREPVTPRRHELRRTVLVAGALSHDAALGRRLAALAARARVPLLADPLSGARLGNAAIAHYDLLLRDPATADRLTPEVVCRVGELPTSKPLRAWLAGLEVPQFGYSADGAWSDPDSRLSQRSVTPLSELLSRLERDQIVADGSDWLERWRTADRLAAAAIGAILDDEKISEPLLAARLAQWLPPEATLFVASSMPIRDLESYQPVNERTPRMLSNRGANGIDGTVSSAFGAAAVSDGPVVLLTGDVALAHDIGGLMAARRTEVSLTIVLVNNDGGGIFHFLPVAGERDVFEHHVATPHGLEFAHAAALYGCEHTLAQSVGDVRAALARSLGAPGAPPSIIEVRTQRARNLELHRRISAAVLSSLSEHAPALPTAC
ncbi:MAG: 2-succinyl-5-enolpyruvyl-6-hydroxy-3-cyclohexene-1-carboxylic-acid synthase [Solirubrobacteraceae bacterium]